MHLLLQYGPCPLLECSIRYSYDNKNSSPNWFVAIRVLNYMAANFAYLPVADESVGKAGNRYPGNAVAANGNKASALSDALDVSAEDIAH